MHAEGYRCACTPMHERSHVHRHVRQHMEEHALTCTRTQTWFAHAASIHVCTQVDVHARTHSHASADYRGDAPQQIGTSPCSAHSPPYTRACAPVHTQGVFQGGGAVRGLVASHLSELPWHRESWVLSGVGG